MRKSGLVTRPLSPSQAADTHGGFRTPSGIAPGPQHRSLRSQLNLIVSRLTTELKCTRRDAAAQAACSGSPPVILFSCLTLQQLPRLTHNRPTRGTTEGTRTGP